MDAVLFINDGAKRHLNFRHFELWFILDTYYWFFTCPAIVFQATADRSAPCPSAQSKVLKPLLEVALKSQILKSVLNHYLFFHKIIRIIMYAIHRDLLFRCAWASLM